MSVNLPESAAAGASHLATVMGPVKGLFFEASIKLYNILIFVSVHRQKGPKVAADGDGQW